MSCLVPLIYLCPREGLALRLDLCSFLLLMQSPFLVQLLFAFVHRSAPCVSSCGAVCAVSLFLLKYIVNIMSF